MKARELPKDGLCASLYYDKKLEDLFTPDDYGGNTCAAYWGYAGERRTKSYADKYFRDPIEVTRKFTTIRQNVLLLMAAMNNEL